MKKRERLATAQAPDGTELTLWRHDADYTIRVGPVELMSTRRHHSEDALATLGCAGLAGRPRARVLVGGLGLGYTLRAVLRMVAEDARVVVAELVPEIVEWHETYDLSAGALRDARVELRVADVADVLKENPASFDAILLDVDNGPDALSSAGNARLYLGSGVVAAMRALRPEGRLAYWSSHEEPAFEQALRDVGLEVHAHRVRAHATAGPMHTIYVADAGHADRA